MEDAQFNASPSGYFSNIVNFRNTIVYNSDFSNDTLEVWDLITNRLTLLDGDLKNVVHSLNIRMGTAIEAGIMKYFKLDDKNTVEFLKKLNRKMY